MSEADQSGSVPVNAIMVPPSNRPVADPPSSKWTPPEEDYVTQESYVMYDEAGNVTQAGRQGVAFNIEAVRRGDRLLRESIPFVHGLPDLKHFVDVSAEPHVLRDKSACPATLDGLVLRNLPVPCRVSVSNPTDLPTVYPCADPEVTLHFDHPGTYAVRVTSAPFLDGEFKVTANG